MGAALLGWARWLWDRLDQQRDGPDVTSAAWPRVIGTILVVGIVVLGLFWAASDYAQSVGRGLAQTIITAPAVRPGVVVFSDKRLFLGGPGVTETHLSTADDAAYHYRYTGFRLMIQSGGNLVLIPEGWTPRDGTAVVLPTASVRVEFSPAS